MGINKRDNFTDSQNALSEYARVLSSPARIAILDILLKKNDCICGDIVDSLGLSQSTVSQHLKELKTIGLIQGSIDGTKVCYCIHADNWNKMCRLFETFLGIQYPKYSISPKNINKKSC
ncbi:MAG: winged helix-turn-helix transcriptional regulator [Leptospira sp.]|nr:winged helix-turn-helix transcriptional regulator [Leptospira sp.]